MRSTQVLIEMFLMVLLKADRKAEAKALINQTELVSMRERLKRLLTKFEVRFCCIYVAIFISITH